MGLFTLWFSDQGAFPNALCFDITIGLAQRLQLRTGDYVGVSLRGKQHSLLCGIEVKQGKHHVIN
ncbi:hypothetical protein ACT691_03930 [Vibrio metschnikovii]